jgi:hypothetical protein
MVKAPYHLFSVWKFSFFLVGRFNFPELHVGAVFSFQTDDVLIFVLANLTSHQEIDT